MGTAERLLRQMMMTKQDMTQFRMTDREINQYPPGPNDIRLKDGIELLYHFIDDGMPSSEELKKKRKEDEVKKLKDQILLGDLRPL